jgi:ribosome-associated translation inhibitor RaiA
VWDTYRDELKEYNLRLAELDPTAQPVAEAAQEQMVAAGLDAFEKLERQLAAQQRRQQREQQREIEQQQKRQKQEQQIT